MQEFIIELTISFGAQIKNVFELIFLNNFFQPSSAFFTIAGTFSVTVLAIVIPLSTDVIGRLANRYKSDIIARNFIQEKINLILRICASLLIFIVLILSFWEFEREIIFNFLSFVSFVLSGALLGLVLFYFVKLNKYMVDSKYIFNELLKNMEQQIVNPINEGIGSGNYSRKSEELFNITQGMGDIMLHTSEINKTELTKKYLGDYTEQILNLFRTENENLDAINKLLSDEDFYKEFQEDPKKSSLKLKFAPKEQFPNMKVLLNQYIRMHEENKYRNNELNIYSIYNLIDVLEIISEKSDRRVFVEIVLRDLTFKLFQENIDEKIDSLPSISADWYKIYLNQSSSFYYLDLYNKYFKMSLSLIIKHNKNKLFENVIINFVDGIPILETGTSKEIYELIRLLSHYNMSFYKKNEDIIENKREEIKRESKLIYNKNSYYNWLETVEELIELISKGLDSEKIEADKIANVKQKLIERGKDNLRLNNIYILSCYIGAYSIYQEQYKFINKMWRYKQPEDARGTYTGHDIYPKNIRVIFRLILDFDILRENFAFSEGHRSLGPYMRKYFVLLLFKLISEEQIDTEDNLSWLSKYKTKNLISLKHSFERLKSQFDNWDFKQILKDENIARNDKLEESVNELGNYFVGIQNEIENINDKRAKELDLNPEIINNLKNDIYEGYSKNVLMKKILFENDLISWIKSENIGDDYLYKIEFTKVDRRIFIEDFNNIIGGLKRLGADFAIYIKNILIEKILSCNYQEERIQEDCLGNKLLSKLKSLNNSDDRNIIFVLLINYHVPPKNINEMEEFNPDKTDNRFIYGNLEVNELQIPLYNISTAHNDKQVLIFKTDPSFSFIEQGYNNQFDLENTNFNIDLAKNILSIDILDLAKEKERKEYIDLIDCTEDEKKEKLKSKAAISVKEKVKINESKINNKFKGYRLIIDKNH